MVDLNLIASIWEAQADATEKCAATMPAHCRAKKLGEVAALRECCRTLRTPGVSDRDALASITAAAKVYAGAK